MSEDNGPPMESLYRSHLLQASLVIPTYGHALRLVGEHAYARSKKHQ